MYVFQQFVTLFTITSLCQEIFSRYEGIKMVKIFSDIAFKIFYSIREVYGENKAKRNVNSINHDKRECKIYSICFEDPNISNETSKRLNKHIIDYATAMLIGKKKN